MFLHTLCFSSIYGDHRDLHVLTHSFPTRRSSDLCPDWSDKPETDQQLGASTNFGCGVNGNLAAMIANPEDLVRGQTTDSDLRTATSNRAISTYREKRSEEHTSELQSLMRISYAVFCLRKHNKQHKNYNNYN